ncbi:MAG: VCBS repeat-containing protein [Akkermansiaceae bacterium]|jgi:hypothetical protein|nr:VCBS repeat-containing protein [Akkermansiaceae bacterium]
MIALNYFHEILNVNATINSSIFVSCKSSEEKKVKKLEGLNVKDLSLDVDGDGKNDIKSSMLKQGNVKILSSLNNIKEKASFLMTHNDGKVTIIFGDLDKDGFYENIAILDDEEEVVMVLRQGPDGALSKAPLALAKEMWLF